MLKASSRIGVSATTLRVAGLVADERHLADDRARRRWSATCWPPEKTPASPSSTKKHSMPTSPWSIRIGAGLGVDRLAEGGDLGDSRPRARWRTAAGGEGPRSPTGATLCDGMLLPPGTCVAGSTYPGRDHCGGVDRRRGRSAVHGRGGGVDDGRGGGLERPAVDDEVGVAVERRRPPRPAVAGVGSPWRLALVAASGPTRAATARTRSWSGTRSADRCSPARRGGARRPAAEGSTSVSGPGQQRCGDRGDRGPTAGSASASAWSTVGAEHGERDVGGAVLQREQRGRSRPRSAARAASP